MLFWSFILAFISGILYYNLYPRSDMIEVHDKPVAEAAIVGFINSHQSAKNSLYHFEKGTDGEQTIVLDYVHQMPLVPSSVSEVEKQGLHLFDSQSSDAPYDKVGHINTNIRDAAMVGLPRYRLKDIDSFVACLKVNINEVTNTLTKELTFNCDNEQTQNYVVTYMDQPKWWNDEVRTKELWRSAMLRRTKGSDECGVLYPRIGTGHAAVTGLPRFDENSEYVLDNSQRYILSVPKEITSMMKMDLGTDNLSDLLFCITSVQNIVRNAQNRGQVKYKGVETNPETTVP